MIKKLLLGVKNMGSYNKLNPSKNNRIPLDVGLSLNKKQIEKRYIVLSTTSIFFVDDLDGFFFGRNRNNYKVFRSE